MCSSRKKSVHSINEAKFLSRDINLLVSFESPHLQLFFGIYYIWFEITYIVGV